MAAALKIAGVAVIAVSAAALLRSVRPELAVQVSLAAGVVILGYAISLLSGVTEELSRMAAEIGLEDGSLKAVLKVTGIAYVAQFASDVCRDAGESAVASRAELAGRILMIAAAFPLISSTVSALRGLFP